MKKINDSKIKTTIAVFKFAILLTILVAIPIYLYFFQYEWFQSFSSSKEYFLDNKKIMMIAYIVAQAIQIVICFIPGQWLQMVAGYLYGVPITFILSILGALLGSIIAYYIAKVLGRDVIYLFFKEETINRLINKLNSKKAFIIMFLIFLVPGIPKDLCSYAAGISNIKLKPFLFISILGRTPAMLGSIIIGKQIDAQEYTLAIIIGVLAILCFLLGIVYRHKLNLFLDNLYDKHMIGGESSDESNNFKSK